MFFHSITLCPWRAVTKFISQSHVLIKGKLQCAMLFQASGSLHIPSACNYLPNSLHLLQFRSVQLLSHVWLFVTPWTVAHEAFLYITNSRSLLKLMSIELVMPSNHLIFCHPLLLLPSIFHQHQGVFQWVNSWWMSLILLKNRKVASVVKME